MMIIPATHRFSVSGFPGRCIHKNRSRDCDTGCVLCHISMVFTSILIKPQKALLRWLFHLHSNFQLIPSRNLLCGRDRPSTLFYANNRS